MRTLKLTVLVLAVSLVAPLHAAERLIYAVSNGAGTPALVTTFYAVSPDAPQPVQLFSDGSLPVMMAFSQRAGSAPRETAVAGMHMFAPARERSATRYPPAQGIYEFSLDGSGQPRKILDIPKGERVDRLIVKSDGSELAYLSLSGKGLTLFIHDVTTGRLLHKLDMLKVAGDCYINTIGWLPDDKTLFFTMETGDDDSTTDEDYKRVGTWLMQEDGSSPVHLPQRLGAIKKTGFRFQLDLPPRMLGVVDGKYLFNLDMFATSATAHHASSFLVLADPQSGAATEMDLDHPPGMYWFLLSPSGRYIAYTQQAGVSFAGNKMIHPPEHLFVRSLQSGQEHEVLSLQTSVEGRIGLSLIGWSAP